MTHLSGKFHENPSSRFREIACTKSVRKRIIIITRFDLVASNEKVFRSITMRQDFRLVNDDLKHTRKEIKSIVNNFPLLIYTFGVLKVHNTTKYSILSMQVSLFKV